MKRLRQVPEAAVNYSKKLSKIIDIITVTPFVFFKCTIQVVLSLYRCDMNKKKKKKIEFNYLNLH